MNITDPKFYDKYGEFISLYSDRGFSPSQIVSRLIDDFDVQGDYKKILRKIKYFRNERKPKVDEDVTNTFDTSTMMLERATVKTETGWMKYKSTPSSDLSDFIKEFESHTSSKLLPKQQGSGIAVCPIADLHAGANVQGLIMTPDFSPSILKDNLSVVASDINSHKFSEVHIPILGDLIESIMGVNHAGSFQEMLPGSFGGDGIILSHKIISHFLSSIANLKKVYIISGNHDRLHENKELDFKGGVAQVIAHMLSLEGFDVEFHPLIISRSIDSFQYVLSHDHHKSRNNAADFILKYGDQRKYNIALGGHLHTSKRKSSYMVENVIADEVNYTVRNIRPLFTGNFYSEALGYTSQAGYEIYMRSRYNGLENRQIGIRS